MKKKGARLKFLIHNLKVYLAKKRGFVYSPNCSYERSQGTAALEPCSVLSQSCLEEGGEVQGGGGGRRKREVEKGWRGTTGKEVVSYWAVCIHWESLHLCAPELVSLTFQLVVYQRCHVCSLCSKQQERGRAGLAGVTTKSNRNSEQRICVWWVSASILRRKKSEEQTCLAGVKGWLQADLCGKGWVTTKQLKLVVWSKRGSTEVFTSLNCL